MVRPWRHISVTSVATTVSSRIAALPRLLLVNSCRHVRRCLVTLAVYNEHTQWRQSVAYTYFILYKNRLLTIGSEYLYVNYNS